jgi:DNA mismatch repair protein MutS
VETFVKDRTRLSMLQSRLDGVRDLERLIAKVDSGRANARDLKALAESLRPVPDLKGSFDASCSVLSDIQFRLVPELDLVDLIDRGIAEDPNVILTEGNLIAPGYNSDLDELRNLASEGHRWIAEYQAREIERTGIKTLKVRRNSVFGFYIEISKAMVHQAPPEYERRQTLTSGERFTTPELKEYEQKVVGAQEKSFALEQELFRAIVARAAERTASVQQTAIAIGELDVMLSFADRALAAGYVRPEIDDSDILDIEDGRHPIIG